MSVLGDRVHLMSEPVITPPGGGADDVGARDVSGLRAVGDLRDLDARGVVEAIVASRRAADAHEARLLALAVHFVDLHPVVPGRRAASWDPDEKLPVGSKPRPKRGELTDQAEQTDTTDRTDQPALTDRTNRIDRIAGEGTPSVAEYAVEELGAALGVPYRTALQLVADALELCYRLPRLWALVQAGSLQAWKGRQVAQLTMDVSPVAAGFVDRHLAFEAAKNRVPGLGRLRALVHEALLQHDPEVAAAREEAALARRGVWFDHRDSTATTQLSATLDTLDALDLDNTLSDLADQLRQLGDTDPLDVRRAHALGALAHPQHLLDLTGGPDQAAGPADGRDAGDGGDAGEGDNAGDGGVVDTTGAGSSERPVLRLRNKTTAHLYLHVSLADLIAGQVGTLPDNPPGTDDSQAGQDEEPRTATGWVEKLGPATLDLIRDWLTRADSIQLRAVLHAAEPGAGGDPDAGDDGAGGGPWPAVDQHDPPEWMREIVTLRDGHCVFPGCTVDARGCDQDHIVAYVPIDEGGPPGQTSVQNLACLCRRHHRLKTFTAWRYQRLPDGDYQWTSPTGHTYLARPIPKR
jgi:hypothetical protein